MSKRIVEIVHEHILPIVEPLHVELVDVEFVKEGPNYFLRVYVDQENGMGLLVRKSAKCLMLLIQLHRSIF